MLGQGKITIQNITWQVSLAADPADLSTGLGNLPKLMAGTGELFDLGRLQIIQVTTVPMLFALDIAFLDENLTVTEVYYDIQPGYLVTSQQPACYFLEVNAGELAEVKIRDQAELEVTSQPVINTSSATGWLDLLNSWLPLLLGIAFLGMLVPWVKSLFREETVQPQLLAATRKKAIDIEVEIVDWGPRHKLVKIYRNGRVYAATYAEPFPTKESAKADYLADPRSFLPFDESTGKYLLKTCKKENGKFQIKTDRMGNLIITHNQRPGKDIFLQFKSDKEPVYSLLRRGERKDLDAGWPVEIFESEPRAGTLEELWEVSCPESLQNVSPKGIQGHIPGQSLDYLPDSQEFLAYTIEDIGYREKIDRAFQEAIQRARRS
jgi:uncharacterized membrane protein (UPF0127 family)